MRSHVVSAAGGNPTCLTFLEPLDLIFANGFGTGNTSAWSGTEP
jgi:hypothetical protein